MKKFARILALASLTTVGAVQAPIAHAQFEPFVGQIMCAGFNFAPIGWARLEGQLLQISENTALFSLLGTTFGGDGRSTFGLPDMRGRVPIGPGQASGLSNYNWGQTGGTEQVALSTTQLPAHTHSVAPIGSNNNASAISPAGKVPAAKARTTLYTAPANTVAMASTTSSSTGGGQAHENRPPYLAIHCFIALTGVYPPRPPSN